VATTQRYILNSLKGLSVLSKYKKTSAEADIFFVIINLVFSFLFSIFLYFQVGEYCSNIADPIHHKFFFLEWDSKPRISLDLIGIPRFIILVVFPAIIYTFIHPIIGKIFVGITHYLAETFDIIYSFEDGNKIGNWTSDGKLIASSLWPFTIILIALLTLGILIGIFYRSHWR